MSCFFLESQLIEIVSTLIEDRNQTRVIVTESEAEAQRIEKFLRQLTEEIFFEKDILYIPGFYQAGVFRFESSRKIIAKRLESVSSLSEYYPRIFICSILGFTRNFPTCDWMREHKFTIQCGDDLSMDCLLEKLSELSYLQVKCVEEIGEFAVRGALVDFWTPGEKSPSRVEIFGDTVDKMRSFRVFDQKSFQNLDQVTILPSREFVWPRSSKINEAVEKFNHAILNQKIMGVARVNLLEDLQANVPFPGIDDVFYMFSDNPFKSFIEYAQEQADFYKKDLFVCFVKSEQNFLKSLLDLEKIYENSFLSSAGKNYLVGKIDSVFPNLEKSKKYFKKDFLLKSRYDLTENLFKKIESLEKQKLFQKISQIKFILNDSFHQKISDVENVLILCNSYDSFIEIFGIFSKYFQEKEEFKIPTEIPKFSIKNIFSVELNAQKIFENFYFCLLNSHEAFLIPLSKTLVISENWLRGISNIDRFEDFSQKNGSKNIQENSQALLSTQYADFSDGDLVVHVQHGIAKFKGLVTLSVLDIVGDFLILEYAGNDKIYVPVHKLNLIQKYIGISEHASLDSLKASSWEKRKAKVKRDVEKVAQELMEHQAKRAMTPGHAFSKKDEDYIAFEDAFPFEETPDQIKAIKEILNDMEAPQAMDRLLCGDVGFGKTEVAMRAAFKCVLDGKQVAWLVPTTVLAHQHYRSLKERFLNFGVQVEILDRSVHFSSKILLQLQQGQIDILIGTHRILSQDIQFRDLGLLIVDEEQRFGVVQKEKIKSMSYGIDVLTLSATPIPRTLQMAMIGLRQLSLLTTPPKSRLATKTFVCPFEESMIKECITFELNRKGQIFYVHNRVEELDSIYQFLQNLLPDAKICIGHGKLSQKELEKTILNFLDGTYQILLCTTIIESGIDMPNVNTIIVQNAHCFGLAQLYQLRGRVGRRSTRGYAYFLTSPEVKAETEGMQRLEILKEHQELGSGFAIASHDMELRGAGNILGDQQSGKASDVGLETYLQMLDDAIKSLGKIPVTVPSEVEIQIPVVTQIPESYIQNPKDRLRTYRRFFGARQETVLQSLMTECEDRFGTLPCEVKNLAELVRIRRWLLSFGALSLTVCEDFTEIRLSKHVLQPEVDYETSDLLIKRILDVCNRKAKGMRLSPDGRILLALRKKDFQKKETLQEAISELKRVLSLLAGEVYESHVTEFVSF